MSMTERDEAALGPIETTPPRLFEPATKAAGAPALIASARHALPQLGLARSVQVLRLLNQPGGFDCPGCAWPEPSHPSPFEFCENGVKAVAEEATRERADPAWFAAHSIAEIGALSDHAIGKAGRITDPMVLRPGSDHYVPIAWDDAFALIGEQVRQAGDPDRVLFYTSGRTSNEAAFLWQLLARKLGTNNLPDCSNLCHESSGVALKQTIGVGKGTVTLDDFDHAEVILVFGQNPGTNHPRMLSALQRAVRRGAKVVSINPLPEAGLSAFIHPQEPLAMATGHATPLACLHVPVRINGDIAVCKAILKVVLERGAVDREFIARHTTGWSELEADLAATSWDDLVAGSGVDLETLRRVGAIAADSKATIACWAMGLTQHENAVGTIQMVVAVLLAGGHIGRPGAGACPVRGHSNVQGDRTMGIYEKMPDAFLDALGREFEFDPPRRHGLAVVPAIEAMRRGEVDVFLAMGGNFLSAAPDTQATAEALRRCRLTVHVSTKPNRSHVVHGQTALILPCLGRTEEPTPVSVEDSMSMVHLSRGNLPPASAMLRSETAIACGIARGILGADDPVPWETFADDRVAVRERISRVVPGFEDFEERVRVPGGFRLPNSARELRWDVPGGKARFLAHPIARHTLADDELLMMTIRTHDQYNTTIYGLDDRYRGIHGGRRVVLMNVRDMGRLGLAEGSPVDLESEYDGVVRRGERFLVVGYSVPAGCCATYFPEANVLVPISRSARGSQTPISKSVRVRVRRSA
ncbi:MAG: FdhF/YdeP family oxidoreductase [Armatimonadota bacterium]